MIDKSTFWIVMPVLAAGTYAIRFSFLGTLGARPLPVWLTRCLRYTAVAVLPALVAPGVLWPAATGGETDPARLAAGRADRTALPDRTPPAPRRRHLRPHAGPRRGRP